MIELDQTIVGTRNGGTVRRDGRAGIRAVLLPGYKLASSLSNNTMALRLMSEQRRQPDALAHALASTQDRLEARGYVDSAVSELRKAMTEFRRGPDDVDAERRRPGLLREREFVEAMRNDFARRS